MDIPSLRSEEMVGDAGIVFHDGAALEQNRLPNLRKIVVVHQVGCRLEQRDRLRKVLQILSAPWLASQSCIRQIDRVIAQRAHAMARIAELNGDPGCLTL